MEPTTEFAQLQLAFVDQTQWRYELIRPLVLFADRTARQRTQETETHPDTVRTLQRRFRRLTRRIEQLGSRVILEPVTAA